MGKTQIYIAALAAIAVFAAGCGGNGGNAGYGSSKSGANSAGYSSASQTSSTTAKKTVVVSVKKNKKFGTILAGAGSRTVYMFGGDKSGSASACAGACAAAWPPVTASGRPSAAGKVNVSKITTFKRSDGTMQVVYAGHPLYYYATDKDGGDAYGQGINGFGADWYVVAPSGKKVD
jgi:predicted lipoprotein with Yx(FWY)xxD motif